jgi:hypothetical protein
VLEILGTAFSVGCQVDGRSPKEISDEIKAGEIDSMFDTIPFFAVRMSDNPRMLTKKQSHLSKVQRCSGSFVSMRLSFIPSG